MESCFTVIHAASLLVLRWKRAKDTLALAEESLRQAMSGKNNLCLTIYLLLIHFVFVLGVAVSEADLEQWIEEEKVCILTKPSPLSSNDSLQ